jgi:hypothetical protein
MEPFYIILIVSVLIVLKFWWKHILIFLVACVAVISACITFFNWSALKQQLEIEETTEIIVERQEETTSVKEIETVEESSILDEDFGVIFIYSFLGVVVLVLFIILLRWTFGGVDDMFKRHKAIKLHDFKVKWAIRDLFFKR